MSQYPPQGQQQYPPQQYPPGQPGQGSQGGNNGMAVASLVLGILGLVFFWFIILGGPMSILAVIFGHLGKKRIDESGGQQGGRGMAIAGLVMGWIGVAWLILVIVLIIAGAGSFEFST